MRLIAVTFHQVHMTAMAFSRSWLQRSRSLSDGNINLVKLTAAESLKGFEHNLYKYFLYRRATN